MLKTESSDHVISSKTGSLYFYISNSPQIEYNIQQNGTFYFSNVHDFPYYYASDVQHPKNKYVCILNFVRYSIVFYAFDAWCT